MYMWVYTCARAFDTLTLGNKPTHGQEHSVEFNRMRKPLKSSGVMTECHT